MGEVDRLMQKHQFKPELMFNADETMIAPGKGRTKVVTRAGDVRPCHPDHAKGEHLTLLLTISAAGQQLTPLVVCPLKNVPPLNDDLYKKFDFTGTDNGWMTRVLFDKWLRNSFVPAVGRIRVERGWAPQEPAVLFIDGPKVHEGLDIEGIWRDHHIVICFLPPHSSALLQPLDLNTNGILKNLLSKLFEPIRGEGATDRRNRLLSETYLALTSACCELHIRTGWRKSGLYPFDAQKPLTSPMVSENAMPAPAPKPAKGKKRVAMHSGIIISNGLPLPDLAPAAPAAAAAPQPPPPKKPRYHVKSSDEESITISRL